MLVAFIHSTQPSHGAMLLLLRTPHPSLDLQVLSRPHILLSILLLQIFLVHLYVHLFRFHFLFQTPIFIVLQPLTLIILYDQLILICHDRLFPSQEMVPLTICQPLGLIIRCCIIFHTLLHPAWMLRGCKPSELLGVALLLSNHLWWQSLLRSTDHMVLVNDQPLLLRIYLQLLHHRAYYLILYIARL